MIPDTLKIYFFVLCIVFCDASHFRGGTISWQPIYPYANSTLPQIEISYRVAWRRTAGGHLCDSIQIANKSLLPGEGSMKCLSGCSGTITLMSYICTDFDETEDWTTGVNSVTYQPLTSSFNFGFEGAAWIADMVVGGGSGWMLNTDVDLTTRADTGEANSSPHASFSPIIRVMAGCDHTFKIPVEDPDGDIIRCRWGSGEEECGGVCTPPDGIVLHQHNCTLRWHLPSVIGWHPIAIIIEDFAPSSASRPLSKIPIQFLINVFSHTGVSNACGSKPVFVSPTPVSGTRIRYPDSGTYQTRLVARTQGSVLTSIVGMETISPVGVTKSQVSKVTGTTNDYYVDITWIPPASMSQDEIFCYTARDSLGFSSDQVCIILLAEDTDRARLVGGRAEHEGRVEIFVKGAWGSICDDSWDLNDAHVVCRQLGFSRAAVALSKAVFGAGSGQIWLDEVSCYGNETSLSQCPSERFGVHDCTHEQDAGVVCIREEVQSGYNSLLDYISANYNHEFRSPFSMGVEVGINILKILDVSLRKQIVTMDNWLILKWTDHRLAVNESILRYFQVDETTTDITIPAKLLYTPDVRLLNGFGQPIGEVSGRVNVRTGEIMLIRPYRYEVYCNALTWPSKNVTCSMKFGSWTSNDNDMHLFVGSFGKMDMQPETGICTIVETEVSKGREQRECFPGTFYDQITFHLNLRCYHNGPPSIYDW